MTDALARHILFELYGCDAAALDDADAVEAAVRRCVDAIGAELLSLAAHRYSPQGVTCVAVLAESHLSVHTWPEHDYAAADVYTCGAHTRPERAEAILRDAFAPGDVRTLIVDRGDLTGRRGPSPRATAREDV